MSLGNRWLRFAGKIFLFPEKIKFLFIRSIQVLKWPYNHLEASK
jgi:hypothetical protein